jgi:hypothetical protein
MSIVLTIIPVPSGATAEEAIVQPRLNSWLPTVAAADNIPGEYFIPS